MTLTWEEAEVAALSLLTDKNGVEVWPNASTWMRVESSSRSRSSASCCHSTFADPMWVHPGFKRGPGRPHTNWRSTVNKDGNLDAG